MVILKIGKTDFSTISMVLVSRKAKCGCIKGRYFLFLGFK
jgi:hypothetical protein